MEVGYRAGGVFLLVTQICVYIILIVTTIFNYVTQQICVTNSRITDSHLTAFLSIVTTQPNFNLT